ncbi:MAG TPA: hypothetical protein VF064_15550 [Pyrinomonadaceae bacterium]
MAETFCPFFSKRGAGGRKAKGKRQRAKVGTRCARIHVFSLPILPLASCLLPFAFREAAACLPPFGRVNYSLNLEVISRSKFQTQADAGRLSLSVMPRARADLSKGCLT